MFMIWTLVRGRYLSYGAPGRPYSSVLVFFFFSMATSCSLEVAYLQNTPIVAFDESSRLVFCWIFMSDME